jgi:hypothetical protein
VASCELLTCAWNLLQRLRWSHNTALAAPQPCRFCDSCSCRRPLPNAGWGDGASTSGNRATPARVGRIAQHVLRRRLQVCGCWSLECIRAIKCAVEGVVYREVNAIRRVAVLSGVMDQQAERLIMFQIVTGTWCGRLIRQVCTHTSSWPFGRQIKPKLSLE